MKLPIRVNLYQTRASVPLVAALVVQAAAAVFFFGETLTEFKSARDRLHSPAELTVALALIIGIVLSVYEFRMVLRRADEQASALEIVRTTFARVLKRQFDLWRLTPAERQIARLSLEGRDVEEISRIRRAALGTIRAQFARIYAKSGVSNRAQFASIFLTELIGSPQVTTPNQVESLDSPNE